MNQSCTVCGSVVHARGLCRRHYRIEYERKRVNPCACGCGELVERTYKHGHWSRSTEAAEKRRDPERNRKISEAKKGIAAGGRPRRRPTQLHLYLRPTHAERVAIAARIGPDRPGDRKQARARVQNMVRSGGLPHPQTVPCMDCGHRWRPGDPRHEYDHREGYGAGQHLAVDPVCQPCHLIREAQRLIAARDGVHPEVVG